MATTSDRPLFQLEGKLGCKWQHLRDAEDQSSKAHKRLVGVLDKDASKFATEDTNLVVFGSFARREWIPFESDLDWTFFVDGQANSVHLRIAQQIKKTVVKELDDKVLDENGNPKRVFEDPGQTGTFGNLAFSHQLVHAIGGQDDTNKNMTQRILLLLESAPVGARSAYDRVVRAVVNRYLEEEAEFLMDGENRFKVPRFLLNDIVRFWRTMAVDFASKQRDRGESGWGLRNAKLRMSRKLIFASGLLICFSCSLDETLQSRISSNSRDINLKHLQNHIWEHVSSTPLDILASAVQKYDLPDGTSELLFSAYDEFLAMMSDAKTRNHLKHLKASDSRTDSVFATVRATSKRFEEGLNQLFFGNDLLRPLTEKYGVF